MDAALAEKVRERAAADRRRRRLFHMHAWVEVNGRGVEMEQKCSYEDEDGGCPATSVRDAGTGRLVAFSEDGR